MPIADSSIIILAHAGDDTTRRCLESLLAATTLPKELFVVDNASAGDIPNLIAAAAPRFTAAGVRFVTWRNRENKGCSAARNEAWEQASGKYVAFMDNDAAVCSADWLGRLVGRLEADPGAALIGPKLIYPQAPHPIQCAGVSFSPRGRVCFRGRGAARHEPRFAACGDVHALISACWVMRNSLRREIGGLDELFHPVQYEDLDLCLRARIAGWRCVCDPGVEMYHFEGTSTEAGGQNAYQRNIAANSLKFRERWHGVFATLPPDPETADYRWIPRAEMGLEAAISMPINNDC